MEQLDRQQHLRRVLSQVKLPVGIDIRLWRDEDFPLIQQMSLAEGWTSPTQRPAESFSAWQSSWPALVATHEHTGVGFVRGLTDEAITLFIAELAVDAAWRGRGISRALLDVCHALYPTTRVDLLADDNAHAFYLACGFRIIHNGMRCRVF
jgi:GNAT superfamily N-acetyltransferase